MSQKIILIVDDDPSIIGLLRAGLENEGWRICSASSGDEALKVIGENSPDIVLLDINMPGMSGFEACRRIATSTKISVIMLTARGEIADEVECFNLGAVGYITKPFQIGDVIARVKLELRRQEGLAAIKSRYISGDLEINFDAKNVRLKGQEVNLAPKEYFLLEALAADAGKALSIEELLRRVWGPNYHQERQYIHEHIRRLRAKIEADPEKPAFIITVPGTGYRFEG